MDVIKQSAEPVINSWTMYYLMARLPSYLSKIVFDMVTDKCSMVVSNVPGPRQKLSMNGDVVEGAVFWPPQRSKVGKSLRIFHVKPHQSDLIRLKSMAVRLLVQSRVQATSK